MGPTSRSEASATLTDLHSRLADLLAGLSKREFSAPRTIGNGAWSVKDLVSHVTFWEELAVRTVDEWRGGRRPSVEDILGGGTPAVDAANEDWYHRTAHLRADQVRRRSEEAHAEVLRAVAGLRDEEWEAPPAYDSPHEPTLGALLGSVLGAPGKPFRHVEAHLPDLRTYARGLRD
jgi:hypothetical protein